MKNALKIASMLILNIVLVVVAVYLLKYLLIPAILATGFMSFFRTNIGNGFRNLSHYLRTVAISIDQLGNVICSDLLDLTLTKKDAYNFGNPDETISGVLGKNQRLNKLSLIGKGLNGILSLIEKDHSIKAIEEDEN